MPFSVTVPSHHFSVDEANSAESEDTAYKAFCECGWSGDVWHHSTDYDGSSQWFGMRSDVNTDPAQAAYNAAEAEGQDHQDGYALEEGADA